MQNIQELIREEAVKIGIDKIGFCEATPFDHLEDHLREQREKGYTSGFEHKVIEERVYPELIFDKPKSIISIALAYPSRLPNKPERVKGERRGEFARASWGIDYHSILNDRMDKLIDYMRELTGNEYHFKSMVDTGALIDVAVAERAGLGFIGRNGLLITEEFGSFVYLGEIITDAEFAPDERVPFGCGECTRCVDACPTDALLGDGSMNAKRCLSYQTQTKGYMPEEYRKKNGHMLYGCDICQLACPYNKGIDSHIHEEMEVDPEIVNPKLKPILTISNKEFKEKFGPLAGSWRGKKPIQRNAIIALGNFRDRSAVPQLLQLIESDPRPMIRGTSAWAISKIYIREYNPDIIEFLEEALEKETELETISEFEQAIYLLKNIKK